MIEPPNTRNRRREDAVISVVMPVYNEADVLETLLEKVVRSLTACRTDYEIIFVDDGSSDLSSRILDTFPAENRRVRVIHLARNFGHQAAVQAGLTHAGGDAVVLMDSDLQDDPEAIPEFVERWLAGYDVVYAVRTDRKENRLKRFLFGAFHHFLSRVANVPIPADAGIFGLVDRRVVQRIVAMGECDRYFPGLRSWVGLRQVGVEVERHARYDAHPRVSLLGLFRLAKTAVFSFSRFPLAIFYAIGGLAATVFLGLSAYSLFCKWFTDLAIAGWTSQVLIGSFFGALNALGICILGEYMVRIYDQVRDRPQFLVDRRVNFTTTGRVLPDDVAHFDSPDAELLRDVAELLRAGPLRIDADASLPASDPPPEPVTCTLGEDTADR